MIYVSHNHPPPPRRRRISLIVILVVIVVGLAITVYVGHHHPVTTPPQGPTTQQPLQATSTTQTTQFAFYSLLPKMEVVIPQDTPAAPNANVSQRPGKYLLQVASLQNPVDAERFKAHLVSLGLMATIQPYQRADGVIWNRVLVGPYDNLTDVEHAQETLHRDGIDSLFLKVK